MITTQQNVLDWLYSNHPNLHESAEIERAWVWLTADLRGDHNKAIRESIKQYGFKYAANGHALPSGNISRWGHSCDMPTRFKRRGKGAKANPKENEELTPEMLAAAFA